MFENKYILTFDLGTTTFKLVLFDKNLNTVYTTQKELKSYQEDGYKYQKAEDWWNAVKELSQKIFTESKIKKEEIIAVAATGQMEDCLLLNAEGEALTEVLLYSDDRAEKEYQQLLNKYSSSKWEKMSGGNFDQLMSINKYIWFKNNRKEAFKNHKYLSFGSKDYLNFKLSGKNITDYTNASTTGFLDFRNNNLNKELISDLNFNEKYLPEIKRADNIIGELNKEAAAELNLSAGIPIINGSGDVGASTLGAGAFKEGDIYCYLGTTGWLAAPSKTLSENKNLFSLTNFDGENYIIAGAVLNAGQAYDWFLKNILRKDKLKTEDYREIEKELKTHLKTVSRTLFIPYLNGERSPVKVKNKNGSFFNLSVETDLIEMLKAVLEGVSFSLKHNLEEMNIQAAKNAKINLIGGGSKGLIWTQILADILNRKINILDLDQSAPSLGTAMLSLKALGKIENYSEIIKNFKVKKEIIPRKEVVDDYQEKYENYLNKINILF